VTYTTILFHFNQSEINYLKSFFVKVNSGLKYTFYSFILLFYLLDILQIWLSFQLQYNSYLRKRMKRFPTLELSEMLAALQFLISPGEHNRQLASFRQVCSSVSVVHPLATTWPAELKTVEQVCLLLPLHLVASVTEAQLAASSQT